MKSECIVEFYEANKNVGGIYPFMIVVADTTLKYHPTAEHFVFTGLPQKALVSRRVVYTPQGIQPATFDWESYPEISSAKFIVKSEFAAARAAFEFAISESDRNLHKELFWSGRNFVFEPVKNCDSLSRWKLAGRFEKELRVLLESDAKKVKEIGQRIDRLPKIIFREDKLQF